MKINKIYSTFLLCSILFLSVCDKKEVEPVLPKGCLLKSITDGYEKLNYIYDDQGKVLSVRVVPTSIIKFNERKIEYEYDDERIKKINVYILVFGELQLHQFVTVDYNANNNISKLSWYALMTSPENKFYLNEDILSEYNAANQVVKQTEITYNTNGDITATDVNLFEYDSKGNLIKRVENANKDKPSEIKFIKYDNKFNPYLATNLYDLLCAADDIQTRHNPLYLETSSGGTITYAYEYNAQGLPIKEDMTSSFNSTTNTTYFEYECK